MLFTIIGVRSNAEEQTLGNKFREHRKNKKIKSERRTNIHEAHNKNRNTTLAIWKNMAKPL